MTSKRLFEKLDGLPPYGPMYIPISPNGDPFYSEGFVVRFFKSDGSTWVANFSPGWTSYSNIFEFAGHNIVVVFAGGTCYVMSPDIEKPQISFGIGIDTVLQADDGSLICSDNTHILIIDNKTGELWRSDRISWDGIKDLTVHGNILTGQTYDPTNSLQEWGDFSLDLTTKKVTGGSFQDFLRNNPNLQADQNGVVSHKRPWWKRIWTASW